MQALSIRNLRKTYANGNEALKGINFSVEQGDFYALLGPNGAGKTTAIGIITSLVNKTAGEVEIFGHNIDTELEAAKTCIGLVPQEVNMTADVATWKSANGLSEDERRERVAKVRLYLRDRTARRFAYADQLPQYEAHERAYNKLARTFSAQVETLRKHRNGGKQTVTVQHVNVEDGGKAIVGHVEAGGRGQP